jgi:hypothetical protein
MNYPKTLSYFVNRLSGHSTNNFRLNPQGSTSATPNSIVRFDLPNNAIVDLKDIRFMFNASATGGEGSDLTRLPDKISSLIERVAVYVGGQQVYSGHSAYNRVKHIKDALEKPKCKQLSDPLAHDFIVAIEGNNNPVDGAGTAQTEVYTNLSTPFCVGGGDLLGWFEGMPRMLDMSLLAQATIEFTFAPASVVVASASSAITTPPPGATTGVTYSVSNMRLLVQSYGLNDGGAYDRMVESEIAQMSYLEFNFKEYHTQFDEAFTGNTRWSLAGVQSLDKVYVGFNNANYTTIGEAVAVSGRGITEDKVKAKYFNMSAPSGLTGLQLQINGGFYPSYSATPDECLALTLSASGKDGEIATREQYVDNYFVFAQRFNHPDTPVNVISGLDFSNINMAGSVVATGSFSTAVPIIIVAETTATLRISQQLQMVKIA